MTQSIPFNIHKDNISAFAEVLESYELKNEIGYSTGDGVSVTVWYNEDDENYEEYFEKLERLDDEYHSGSEKINYYLQLKIENDKHTKSNPSRPNYTCADH